jgi:hypothetical protein
VGGVAVVRHTNVERLRVAALHLFGGEARVCGGEERMQGSRVRVAHPEQRQSNAIHAQQRV